MICRAALLLALPLLTCSVAKNATRIKPKDPVPFEVNKLCDDRAMTFPRNLQDGRSMPVEQARGIAIARGRCAVEAIKNGDENRSVAQYNRTAALANAPDGPIDRLKIFGRGALAALGIVGLVVLSQGSKAVILALEFLKFLL